jgi:hypothetical protein
MITRPVQTSRQRILIAEQCRIAEQRRPAWQRSNDPQTNNGPQSKEDQFLVDFRATHSHTREVKFGHYIISVFLDVDLLRSVF